MKFLAFIFSILIAQPAYAVTEFTVHHAPGGPSDKTTRILHKYLPANQYVVVNRPGGQGKIAINHITNSDSLMLATMAQIYVTNKMNGLDYDPNSDLKVIASIGVMPSVLVCRSNLTIMSIPDIIKSKQLSFAVAGYGSNEHLATEVLFSKMNKRHLIVPYSAGGSKSILDLLGGHVDCMFANYPTVKEWVTDKRLTVIMTSHDLGLSVPTWESLYSEKFPFQAMLAIVIGSNKKNTNIQRDLTDVIKNKQVADDLREIGLFPLLGTSNNSIKAVLDNNNRIRDVIVNNNITLK
jgi:tripartite-type tricarboxylate transporter receptor subunit TctC